MAWQQFLFVLPNPWTGIDTDGRTYADPAGHVIHDPAIVPIAERSLVGCSIAGVEILQAARLQTVKVVEPAKRSAGVMVPDVATLVQKLKSEAKVI